MAKYEVEYAQFTKVEIEAESFQEARDIAATLQTPEWVIAYTGSRKSLSHTTSL